MNKDRIEGGARQTMGAAKSTAGRVLDDTQTQAEGVYDQVAGAAQNAFGQAKDVASDSASKIARLAQKGFSEAKDAASEGAEKVGRVVRDGYAGAANLDVNRAAHQAYGQARDAAAVATRQVRSSPLSSVLTIGAICFAVGWLMRGRN